VMKIPRGCLVVLERGKCGCPDLGTLDYSLVTWDSWMERANCELS
jgi:hypothetical protein